MYNYYIYAEFIIYITKTAKEERERQRESHRREEEKERGEHTTAKVAIQN